MRSLTPAERVAATQAVIDRFRDKPFSWAGANCIALARMQAKGLGHVVPPVPRFRSALGAQRAMAKRGGIARQALPTASSASICASRGSSHLGGRRGRDGPSSRMHLRWPRKPLWMARETARRPISHQVGRWRHRGGLATLEIIEIQMRLQTASYALAKPSSYPNERAPARRSSGGQIEPCLDLLSSAARLP